MSPARKARLIAATALYCLARVTLFSGEVWLLLWLLYRAPWLSP